MITICADKGMKGTRDITTKILVFSYIIEKPYFIGLKIERHREVTLRCKVLNKELMYKHRNRKV